MKYEHDNTDHELTDKSKGRGCPPPLPTGDAQRFFWFFFKKAGLGRG